MVGSRYGQILRRGTRNTPPTCSRTHTLFRLQTHAHTNIHIQTLTHTQTLSFSVYLSFSLSLSLSLTHPHTHTHTRTRTPKHTGHAMVDSRHGRILRRGTRSSPPSSTHTHSRPWLRKHRCSSLHTSLRHVTRFQEGRLSSSGTAALGAGCMCVPEKCGSVARESAAGAL